MPACSSGSMACSCGKDNYLAHLDEALILANSLGLYLSIDSHSIGYLPVNIYQDNMYDNPLQK